MINFSSVKQDYQGKRLVTAVGNWKNTQQSMNTSSDEEDCVILEGDPDKPLKVVNEFHGNESDGMLIIAEKGQIACRDYPHARHLCARFPFNRDPHQKYCDMCHCYVCDTRAPCVYWGTGKSSADHCHSTDKEEMWRVLRQFSMQYKTTQLPISVVHVATPLSDAPSLHPALSQSQPLDSGVLSELRLALDRLTVQPDRITGTVIWFNGCYGFICPDGEGDDLFVHKSSIKSDGYQSLYEGEVVEFQIESGDDGRRKAIDVSALDGSLYSSDASEDYDCEETEDLARNYSPPTRSGDEERELLSGLRSLTLDQLTVQPDRLTGTVKWFNGCYGFICPDGEGDDLFVHKSSIKSDGYQSLYKGEVVEFQIESGDDGRRKAIDVSVPGGLFVRGSTRRRDTFSSDASEYYDCEETEDLARNCSPTRSGDEERELLSGLRSLAFGSTDSSAR